MIWYMFIATNDLLQIFMLFSSSHLIHSCDKNVNYSHIKVILCIYEIDPVSPQTGMRCYLCDCFKKTRPLHIEPSSSSSFFLNFPFTARYKRHHVQRASVCDV